MREIDNCFCHHTVCEHYATVKYPNVAVSSSILSTRRKREVPRRQRHSLLAPETGCGKMYKFFFGKLYVTTVNC